MRIAVSWRASLGLVLAAGRAGAAADDGLQDDLRRVERPRAG